MSYSFVDIIHLSENAPVSDLLTPNFREVSLRREKEELIYKLNNAIKDNAILSKQFEQFKREQGELLLTRHESDLQLLQLRHECHHLRERLASQNSDEILRLRAEKEQMKVKFGIHSKEMEILRKQLGHERQENIDLTAEMKRNLKEAKEKCEKFTEEMKRSLKEAEEKCEKMREKLEKLEKEKKEEVEVLNKENNKLKMELEMIKAAATERYAKLKKRMVDLAGDVAALCDWTDWSGPQQTGITNETEQLENFGASEKPYSGVNTASSMSASTVPIILLSDDDEGVPPSKTVKRKLSSKCPANNESGANFKKVGSNQLRNSSSESLSNSQPLASTVGCKADSTKNQTVLKRCENKSEIETDRSHEGVLNAAVQDKIEWEYEADMLDSFVKDTKVCMKAVCALYRQQVAVRRLSTRHLGFDNLNSLRGVGLAVFLMDGDTNGPLKRSVAELQKFDPKGADDCRRIAFSHSEQLFEIYKNIKDPFFGP